MRAGANGEGGAAAMIAHLDHKAEGERRKLGAHVVLEARRALYVMRGRRALLLHLLSAGNASADDVRDAVELPPQINPVCLGVVPGALARAGIIEPDGFTKSRRRDAHARPVQVWRLVDRAAALVWLTAHPNRPDLIPDEADPTLFDLNTNDAPDAATPGARQPRKDCQPCQSIITHEEN